MTARKIYTYRVNDTTPDDHLGRFGEITYRDGYLYFHNGSTPGGELINGGGSGGGGPTSWASVTGKPSFAAVATSGSYADLTNKPSIPSLGDFVFSLGDSSLPAGSTMTLSTYRSGANEESKLTLNPTGESSLYAAGVLKLGTGYGSGSEKYWQFGANGNLTIPGDIVDSTGTSVLGGGGTTLPADASGYLVNDGSGNLSWAAGDGTFSGDYDDLNNKPTIRIAVPTGSGPGGNLQADSLALAGLNPVTDIPSTWGGDLILQGGVGGANGDLYGEVRIKSGQIGANYEWHFTTDKKIKLPAGGDIVDSTGASVLGGGSSFSGSYTDLTNQPTIPADVSDLTDTTGLLGGGGGGTTLPTNASGYLNNDGSGTLTWVPGNPSGSGMLPYNDVVVFSNTVVGDWTSYTLSGTMDAFYDWNNGYATITLSSEPAYGKQITPNTKRLWINDAKIDNKDYLVIEFPASPAVGDVFTVPMVSPLTIVNAGSFVIGETYTIVSTGTTSWTSIGASYGGAGNSFVATGPGSGTGTASTSVGAKKVIFKPQSGARAQTMMQGKVVFGQGGTYDFMYIDLSDQNSGNPVTWVYAGVINSIPTWYQFYF